MHFVDQWILAVCHEREDGRIDRGAAAARRCLQRGNRRGIRQVPNLGSLLVNNAGLDNIH
jgi:hypothetical protein